MTYRTCLRHALATFAAALLCCSTNAPIAFGQSKAAVAAFDSYIANVEGRLDKQHRSPSGFLASSPLDSLRTAQPILEQLSSSGGTPLPGALLHDWRATAFVPGASVEDFERLLKDFDAYPKYFAPQVLQAKVLARQGDRMQAVMRVSQRHVITVVMDSTYDISFGRPDAQHGYSRSKSIAMSEIASAGSRNEHALGSAEEHGFLWRLNTYWSYEERDGGLAIQIESISLSRSIPTGLGWAVRPFIESVPLDSLDFTMQSVCKALSK